ncbi:DUF6458 family protein [Actinomadura sp. HBU206391]|uniref:DUF6458 family protein n=1 Tax=Actinomadura sp. HBU206391 TaxID=2731692 RepID=UPI00164F144D|nr:DUF6458 family protein [Actinomadura sp. HBU206391]MBC6456484.1 hypothetical protein [Actinomadura sp. HBU206391]
MGLGVSLAFVAIGAILAFAVRFDLSGIDIHMIGWILILVGLANLAFTLMYTRPRQRARLAGMVDEDPLYVVRPEEPTPHVHIEQPHVHVDQPVEETVVERRVVETPVQETRPRTEPAQPVPPQPAQAPQQVPPQSTRPVPPRPAPTQEQPETAAPRQTFSRRDLRS